MTLETVADRRLHPSSLIGGGLKQLPQFAIGAPALAGLLSNLQIAYILLIAAAGVALAFGGALLAWMRFRYGVGARDIVIESGILHRQRRVIPFDRIQDIDIEQGPLSRLFGTAKVRIETGGATKNEGNLDAIALADAHRLRETLRHGQAEAGPPAGAADPPVPRDEPLLFRMSLGRVLLAGLFNFSLVFLAIIFGSLEYLDALFGIDPWSLDWVGPARDMVGQATWALTALALALVVLIGIAAGVLSTLARDFNFRLTRAPGGLRRRRGLFTLSEVVIPLRRVQLSIVSAGLVARLFGWHRLEFQTLSADVAKAGHQVAAPLARMEEILPVLAEVAPAALPADDEYKGVSKRHILRQTLRWLTLLAIPVAILVIAFPFALGLLALLPLLVGAAVLQWRYHRYCLTGSHLHIRGGLLTRRHWIIAYERIQSLSTTSGPLQRRLGLASLAIDTAGASAFSAPAIVNLPQADAEPLAAELVVRQRAARAALRQKRAA